MSPFDIVKSITWTKEELDFTDKDYNAFIINRALSYFPDCLFFANEMNKAFHLSGRMQYKYLFHAIPKKKRFSKWNKTVNDKNVEVISEYYNVNKTRAIEYLELLSEKQLKEIHQRMDKGGI